MSLTPIAVAALAALGAWVVLLGWRGGFWRADQRLDDRRPVGGSWPGVVAVIPARNEAPTIGRTITSLLGQDYPGSFSVIVVDDDSDDGTTDAALAAAEATAGGGDRLDVVAGRPLEPGWSGKLWAVSQGLAHADAVAPEAPYVLLTDGDIEHGPETLLRLVGKAEVDGLNLVSLMVMLRCQSPWERLLIPAFVFFFQKLYPFPWVNDPGKKQAAAAGGCILVRRQALRDAGGIESIRGQLIDDCALAAAIKAAGPIWLGLTEDVQSLRAYDGLGDVWGMVTRTAFEQLGRSWLVLVVAVCGMALVYLVAPAAVGIGAVMGDTVAAVAGAAAWVMMAIAYRPTLALYRKPVWWAALLPVAALLYTVMTMDSARRYGIGQVGAWKGRTYGEHEEHAG
jgi:hopene-associated glycosyltransferase HpnB